MVPSAGARRALPVAVAAVTTTMLVAAPSESWQAGAACQGRGRLFDREDAAGMAAAQAVCGWCPVRTECLASALTEEGDAAEAERAGVRGGLTPAERAAPARVAAAGRGLDPAVVTRAEQLLREGASVRAVAAACQVTLERARELRGAFGVPPLAPVYPPGPVYPTVAAAFTANVRAVGGGHVVWTGGGHVRVAGARYRRNRAAFEAQHGRPADGRVLTTCAYPGCVAHLSDNQTRGARRA
ncbi:WhiB family transcriptional regulator [Streptomyces sp. NRRL F-5135]|uniref:WhiB family transcriptional regulator n=1 Tax=Streptomyces sp. NRRL F-5135 TaxID=1463858 RepID=UPI0005663CF6|nr:WhiB family transcriptional regulator [Streptomyces sp. NRRL F-5135]